MKKKDRIEKIAIVIPAHNESVRLKDVLRKTFELYDTVVLVDDYSTDDTSFVAKEMGANVINLKKNMGAGFATKVGCDFAFYNLAADIVVTIDADGQHAPDDIHKLIEKLFSEKLDVVFGFRPRKKNMPFIKRLGNYSLSKLSLFLFNVNLTDTLTGFHAFTKSAYPKLKWESHRYGFVSEYVYRIALNNLKYGEVAVQTIYNEKKGGMNVFDGIKSIGLMLKWKFKM